MKRKVSQVGPATLMVSLPSKWVKQFNVKKGDEIDIAENGNKLMLSIGATDETKKIAIDLSKNPNLLKRYVVDVYRSGFDDVTITFQNPKDIEIIQKTANEILIGYEVVEQSKNSCVLRNVTKDSEEEFENLLRRSFHVTSVMAKNSLEAIKNSDFELLKEAYALELTNDRFTTYCERILSKKGYGTYAKTNFMFVIVYQLEKIADEFQDICEYIGSNKVKVSNDVIKVYDKVITLLELCQRIFYDYSEDEAESLVSLKDDILSKSETLFKSANKHEVKVISHMVDITKLLYNILGCKISLMLD